MRDFWTFRPREVLENKRHLFECKDSKSDTGHSLLVRLAATHAGIVNGNRRFYRPDKMQECVHTWMPQATKDGITLRTPRPVLVGHNEKGDVLGRVLDAKYVDDSWRYAHDFPVVKDFIFYQRDGRKRHNLFDAVDWISENLMPLREYTGLGYTDLGIRITNPEGIRKVLADEYLTVSVGFRTDAAICSICHTDWAEDGKCEHKLGEMVDGKQQFLITGAFDNQEVSFINFAADPFATTIGEKVLKDSLEKIFFLGLPVQTQHDREAAGLRMSDGLFESDINATEELMDKEIKLDPGTVRDQIKSAELTKDQAQELRAQLGAWQPETDELKSERRSLVSTLNAKIRKNGWDKIQSAAAAEDAAAAAELANFVAQDKSHKCIGCDKTFPEDKLNLTSDGEYVCDECEEAFRDGKKSKKKKEGEEEEVEPAANGQSGKKVSKKEAEKTKEFQGKEINAQQDDESPFETGADGCLLEGGECNWNGYEFSDEEKTFFSDVDGLNEELELEIDAAVKDGELPEEIAKDAKLSSESRKKLSDSTFCGPGRSFLVPDCAHVTAARRLIGRAKLSDGTKKKILGCVSRKAKKMNCGTAKKGKDDAEGAQSVMQSADEQKFTDRATKFIDAVVAQDAAPNKEEVSAEQRAELVAAVVALDKAYDRFSKTGVRWTLRWAVRAMLTDWDADDDLTWALRSLKGSDNVVLAKSELDEKEEALNGLMTEKDALAGEVTVLKTSRQSVLAASKKTLAQQIVMHSVLTGKDGFKDLTPDQVNEKVAELAKRHISSLNDSVSDILSGLRWVKQVDSASTASEHEKPMADNARVTDDATVGSNAADKTRAEAEDQALQDNLRIRLRYMTQSERERFWAQVSYKAATQK